MDARKQRQYKLLGRSRLRLSADSGTTNCAELTWKRAAVAAVIAALSLGASEAGASVSPREKAPGPALTTSPETLDAALSCPHGIRGDRDPVLLVPGASGDPTTAFAGLEPVLRAKDYPSCGVTLPDAGFGDIQIQAEYVVASIRKLSARSRRPVSVIAVSSGSATSRWALKWWPDLRSMVGDVIGLAPSNHGVGTTLVDVCGAGPCAPASRQLLPGSTFFEALNGGDETPGRLAHSVIYSATDVNVPAPFSELEGDGDDTNTVIQAICPGRSVDHGHVSSDAVAVALILDALRHNGPARASRVPKPRCERTYPAGVDPAEVERQIAAGGAYAAANYGQAGLTETEPPLAVYATRQAPQPRATLRIDPRELRAGRRTAISLLARGLSGQRRWPLLRAQIKVRGRKVITNADGKASLRLRVPRPDLLRVRLIAPGLAAVTERLVVKPGRARG
jgi:hypothetical protein